MNRLDELINDKIHEEGVDKQGALVIFYFVQLQVKIYYKKRFRS